MKASIYNSPFCTEDCLRHDEIPILKSFFVKGLFSSKGDAFDMYTIWLKGGTTWNFRLRVNVLRVKWQSAYQTTKRKTTCEDIPIRIGNHFALWILCHCCWKPRNLAKSRAISFRVWPEQRLPKYWLEMDRMLSLRRKQLQNGSSSVRIFSEVSLSFSGWVYFQLCISST